VLNLYHYETLQAGPALPGCASTIGRTKAARARADI
jgi:hypothetical protein